MIYEAPKAEEMYSESEKILSDLLFGSGDTGADNEEDISDLFQGLT